MQQLKRRSKQSVSQSKGERVTIRLYVLAGFILVLSLLIHMPLLFVGGLLILFLLVMIDIWAFYSLHEIHFKQELSEQRVLFGEEVTLTITVENAKILPLPVLEFKEVVPRALPIKDQPIRRTLITNNVELEGMFSLSWYERVTRRYTIQCMNRGIYTFGPITIHSSDAFGFLGRDLELSNEQHLLVYPLVVPLHSFNLPARHPFGERRAPRRLLEDPSRVIGLRDYVYGDNLRRIDWKATARTMQLQSKIYESTTTYTMTIFLNASLLMDGYYGIHPELQEMAICVAASVTHWALNEGYAVGLYSNTAIQLPDEQPAAEALNDEQRSTVVAQQIARRRVHLSPSSSNEQYRRIMETLARLQTYGHTPLEEILFAERNHLPTGSTVVIITSSINERLTEQLVHLRRNGYAVAILFVGENAVPMRITGITVYHLGGEQAWEKLLQTVNKQQQKDILAGATLAGFRL
jgi:uncharacterized protein (DUF58 family)